MVNKIRRWLMRFTNPLLFLVMVLVPISGLSANEEKQAPSNSSATHHHINIPSTNLAAALNALAKQTQALFMFPYDIAETRPAKSVTGRYTILEALDIILKDSGLASDLSEKDVIKIYLDDASANNQGKRNMNTKKNLLASTIAFFMGSAVQGVVAQEDAGGQEENGWALEEIVVTAQKREERLIDVPMSISVYDTDTLEKTGIQNIHDLSYAVPSLSVADSHPGKVITLRGVSNAFGSSALVGIYLDELPITALPNSNTTVDLQSMDLERVEVLKGPQGTLYGQGAVGGAIRFISNRPVLDEFSAELGGGISNTTGGGWSEELSTVLNIPVAENLLAFRVAAAYRDKSGWIDNQSEAGRKDINDSELSLIRLGGLLELTSQLTVRTTAIQYRNDGGAASRTNIVPASEAVYRIPVTNGEPLPSTDITNEHDLYNLTLEYDFGFATLVSSSSRLEVDARTALSSIYVELSAFPSQILNQNNYGGVNSAEGFTQELRLTSNNSGKAQWTVGAFYNNSERDIKLARSTAYLGEIFLGQVENLGNTRSTKSISIFGDFSYLITENMRLALGTRYFEDEQTFEAQGLASVDSDFDNLSSKLSIAYYPVENTNVFLSIAEGFRSGGLNDPSATGTTEPVPFDPESVISYEAGVKTSMLDRRLNLETAVFFSEYSDYQILELDPLTGLSSTQNAGEAEIKGVELAVQFIASDHVVLGFNADVTDTEITKLGDLVITQNEGDQLDGVPKYSFSVYGDLNFNWHESIDGFARLDYSRKGRNTFTLRNAGFIDEVVETDTINVLNAQVGAQWRGLSVKLVARNINNEKRATSRVLDNTAAVIRPRTIGIEFNYEF